ncbi:MAG: helix-turn-helix domain-containing protein [Kofleriaceae bacterium]
MSPGLGPVAGTVVVAPGALAWRIPPRIPSTRTNVQFALRVVVPLDGDRIAYRAADGDEIETAAPLVVPPGVPFAMLRGGERLAVTLHPLREGRAIAWRHGVRTLAGAEADRVHGVARSLLAAPDGDPGDVHAAFLRAIEAPLGRLIDPRVRALVDALACDPVIPDLGELGRRAGISGEHLRHLVTAELGEPVRRLGRWFRFLRTVPALWRPRSLAQLAAETGFSDHAHLSRTYREVVGQSPSLRDQVELRVYGDYYVPCG